MYKKDIMLTGLKLSSLASKFYRPEQCGGGVIEPNFEILKMQKSNEATDRTERVDEKRGSFF